MGVGDMSPQMPTTTAMILKAWAILDQVYDPEIPVLTLRDLGIIRDIQVHNITLKVIITPTYSGCPAREVIFESVATALAQAGFKAQVVEQLAPAWTTDWMSESGKIKLKEYGIAPPCTLAENYISVTDILPFKPHCPQCESHNTSLLSAFGSTACKALYRCNNCLEPFEYFKAI